jgi:pyrroline-5-carboxylate reductase
MHRISSLMLVESSMCTMRFKDTTRKNAIKDIEQIFDRLTEIYKIAKEEKVHTQQAAKVYGKKKN